MQQLKELVGPFPVEQHFFQTAGCRFRRWGIRLMFSLAQYTDPAVFGNSAKPAFDGTVSTELIGFFKRLKKGLLGDFLGLRWISVSVSA